MPQYFGGLRIANIYISCTVISNFQISSSVGKMDLSLSGWTTDGIIQDSNGDCKVGDFGLATSSLAIVDPSDVSPMAVATFSDMTMDVGTRLYIAPEILSKRGGSRERDPSKADLYSLGVGLQL